MPSGTVCSGPASATGGSASETLTITRSVAASPAALVTRNSNSKTTGRVHHGGGKGGLGHGRIGQGDSRPQGLRPEKADNHPARVAGVGTAQGHQGAFRDGLSGARIGHGGERIGDIDDHPIGGGQPRSVGHPQLEL